MKSSEGIGIVDYLEVEVPEPRDYPNRELFKESRDKIVEDMKAGIFQEYIDYLPGINSFISEDIKTQMKTKSNYKKGFVVVEAKVNGVRKVKVFASRALAYKVMNFIKRTYQDVDLSYTVAQM